MSVLSFIRSTCRGFLGLCFLAAAIVTLTYAGNSSAANTRDQSHQGHQLLGRHPSTIGNGSHALHTNSSGHKAVVQVNKGKINGVHVTNPKGQSVAVQNHRVTNPQGQWWIGFTFYDAWINCYVTYWFPLELVIL